MRKMRVKRKENISKLIRIYYKLKINPEVLGTESFFTRESKLGIT